MEKGIKGAAGGFLTGMIAIAQHLSLTYPKQIGDIS